MTHDLIARSVTALGGVLAQVEVVALREGTFYAELVLRQAPEGAAGEAGTGKAAERRVDCRPSDAIALAARTGAPIYVAESVLAEAGTRSLAGARLEFADAERDKWTDELENLSPDELKYKM